MTRAPSSPVVPAVVVTATDPKQRARAVEAAGHLGLPFADDAAGAGEGVLALVLDGRGWALRDPRPGAPGAVRSDLLSGDLGRRLRAGARGETRLVKALGLRRHPAPLVLDATAGLGREAVLAAALGCRVVACERSPVVALLLRDGLERAAAGGLDDLVSRIDLRVADARDVLVGLPEDTRPDVVLVDPMFPERRKAAAAGKEMQLLQRLLGASGGDDGGDGDAETPSLLRAALAAARRRVVVKRPAHAPSVALPGRRPDAVVPGRAARYDVYLVTPRDAGPGGGEG